jgi:hypothetical protein
MVNGTGRLRPGSGPGLDAVDSLADCRRGSHVRRQLAGQGAGCLAHAAPVVLLAEPGVERVMAGPRISARCGLFAQ